MPYPRVSIRFTAAAAAVLSAFLALLICKKAPPFYFEVSVNASEEGMAQLYYDNGKGINADDSASTRLPQGRSVIRLPVPEGEYRALRFDPTDHGYCRFSVENAQIINVSGSVTREFLPEEFTAFVDMSRRETTGDRVSVSLSARESDPSMTAIFVQPLQLYSSLSDYWWLALKAFSTWFAAMMTAIAAWVFGRKRGWHRVMLSVALLGVLIYILARSRFYAPINFDESAFLWYGWLVNGGAVPYRDIFEPKGPIIFFVNAWGLSLFGLENFLFRIVPTTAAIASIIVFYVALKKRAIVDWLAVLVVGQVALWLIGNDFHDTGLNDSETYGFAFTVMGLSLGSIASSLQRRSLRIMLQVLSGICFGLAVLTKELFVLSVVPAWLFLGLGHGKKKRDWSGLALSATGVAFTAVLFLGYLLSHAALSAYFEELRFSRGFAATYCIDVGRFPRVTGLAVVRESWAMLHGQLYNFDHLAFVLALCGLIFFCGWTMRQAVGFSRLGVAAVAVVLGMVSISIGHCFWRHYFLMGATGLLMLMIMGADATSRYLREASWRRNLLVSAVLVAAFGFVSWTPLKTMAAESYSRRVASWDPLVSEVIEQHSAPGDYVLAPGAPTIFVAFNRQNPYPLGGPSDVILAYEPTFPPSLRMDALRKQLEQNLPKVCYFPEWFEPQQRQFHELLYDPLLRKHNYVRVNDTLWHLPDAQ